MKTTTLAALFLLAVFVAPAAAQFDGSYDDPETKLNVKSRTDCDSLEDCSSFFRVTAAFVQSGRSVTGTVTDALDTPPGFVWEIQAGTIDSDGTLRLTFAPDSSSDGRVFKLTEWESRTNGETMTGTATITVSLAGTTVVSQVCLGRTRQTCDGWQRTGDVEDVPALPLPALGLLGVLLAWIGARRYRP